MVKGEMNSTDKLGLRLQMKCRERLMGVDVTGEKERPDLKVGDEKERQDVEK